MASFPRFMLVRSFLLWLNESGFPIEVPDGNALKAIMAVWSIISTCVSLSLIIISRNSLFSSMNLYLTGFALYLHSLGTGRVSTANNVTLLIAHIRRILAVLMLILVL